MPIYEYECKCGYRFEELKPLVDRHNAVCSRCGKVSRLLISRLAGSNFFDRRIPLTVLDGNGKVVGRRFDHRPTPQFGEYHPREVLEGAQHGREMVAKETGVRRI